jgi:hypothetical protein
MVSIMVSRTFENLLHFRAEYRFHSIGLTLSARHSAYVGGVHSQFLRDAGVKPAEKRNERRRPIPGFVTIHRSLSGVMTRFQRSRQPRTDVIPSDVLFCLVRHTSNGCTGMRRRSRRAVPTGFAIHAHTRPGFLSAITEKWFRSFTVPEHNSDLIREPIEPIASKGHVCTYGECVC